MAHVCVKVQGSMCLMTIPIPGKIFNQDAIQNKKHSESTNLRHAQFEEHETV